MTLTERVKKWSKDSLPEDANCLELPLYKRCYKKAFWQFKPVETKGLGNVSFQFQENLIFNKLEKLW